MSAIIFGTLTLVSACQSKEYVIVQRCHKLPEQRWTTTKELYTEYIFARKYLENCTKEK